MSDVTAALTDSRKQTTYCQGPCYCLNTLIHIACVAGVNGEGVEIGWKTKGEEEQNETAPYPDNQQPSLISPTRKIPKKQKGRYAHTSTQCEPMFLFVHEYDLIGFEMLNEETAVFDCIC